MREPRAAIERLTRFCGLEWEEACLSFEQAARAVKTASVWQVRERLYQRSSGRWRNYAAHIAPLQAYLRKAGNRPALKVPTGRVRIHCDSTHFSPDVGGMPACTVS